VTGWIILAALLAVALGALALLRVRGSILMLAASAMLFGCIGYVVQGSPGLPGSPREAQSLEAPIPLTDMRHAFFGNFNGEESWLAISEALARSGDTEQAVGVLQNAVGKYPRNAQLWIGLGNALVDHAGVLTPASEYAYQRAAELAPGHPAPLFFMGLALARSGDGQDALALWKEVLARAPADAPWRPMVEDAVAALSPKGPSTTPSGPGPE
jgi:cytochrome c-type biogenesis protein CcmH